MLRQSFLAMAALLNYFGVVFNNPEETHKGAGFLPATPVHYRLTIKLHYSRWGSPSQAPPFSSVGHCSRNARGLSSLPVVLLSS